MLKVVVQPVSLAVGYVEPVERVYRVDLYYNAYSYTSGSYVWKDRRLAEAEAERMHVIFPEAEVFLNKGA